MVTKREAAVALIKEQIAQLCSFLGLASRHGGWETASRRLAILESHILDLLSKEVAPEEGKKFEERMAAAAREVADYKNALSTSPFVNRYTLDSEVKKFEVSKKVSEYTDFLSTLQDELTSLPEILLPPALAQDKVSVVEARPPAASRTVFIIHGHDEVNRLRLEALLRDHWHLEPMVLISEPGKGRTIIEKFEEEAQRAAYAIALLTPDDQVKISETAYAQARPNATFELGWFYGRLGRQRVCILFRKGTKIHWTFADFALDNHRRRVDNGSKGLGTAGGAPCICPLLPTHLWYVLTVLPLRLSSLSPRGFISSAI